MKIREVPLTALLQSRQYVLFVDDKLISVKNILILGSLLNNSSFCIIIYRSIT